MDDIAAELDFLKTLNSNIQSDWFHAQLRHDKKLAGLPSDAPAAYDVRICSTPLLKGITCSRFGGTIELRENASTSRHSKPEEVGPTGKERIAALKDLKQRLINTPTEHVVFSNDPTNPNLIHFRWDAAFVNTGRQRGEYLSMQQIFSVLSTTLDVSTDVANMCEQEKIYRGR